MNILLENENEEVDVPAVPCEKSVRARMQRYGARYSLKELNDLARTTELAAYGNFDPMKNPNGELI